MKKTKSLLLNLLLVPAFFGFQSAQAQDELSLCPICTNKGALICPDGFEAVCDEEIPGTTRPICLFVGSKYTPGCYKFERKLEESDLNFQSNLPPDAKIKIIKPGNVYTLNKETISCRKL